LTAPYVALIDGTMEHPLLTIDEWPLAVFMARPAAVGSAAKTSLFTKSDNRCINHRRPQRVYRCGICLHDAADDDAIRKNIVVVIVPLAGWGEKLMRA
jgi:hypothetical protein